MSEIHGSARWSIEAGQRLTVEREVIVPWVGHPVWVASQIGTLDPLIPLCRCRQARIEPLGPIGGPPTTYTHARVTLTYVAEVDSATPQWPSGSPPTFPSGAQVQLQIRGGGEFMLFPARVLRWEDNSPGNPNAPIPQEDSGVGRVIIPSQEWAVTLSNLGTVNLPKLTNKLGHVNDAAFLGYPPETVLFEAYDVDWQWSLDNGQPKITWSCVWRLKVRTVRRDIHTYGWNHEYRGDPPAGWKRVQMIDGLPRYPLTSFADLFT